MKPTPFAVRTRGFLAGTVSLILLACQPGPPTGVLLITVDTLRADHLGAYGYTHETSPNLDALAKESVLFRQAIAPAPWTLPSVATLFTSLYPTVHGASHLSKQATRSHEPGFRPSAKLATDFVTLPEMLRDQGFATAAFVRGAYPSSVYGFGQGFEHFEENQAYGIRFSTDRLLAWLDRETPERFFIYVHTIEVHSPYEPVAPTTEQLERATQDERERLVSASLEEALRYRSFDPNPEYQGAVNGTIQNLRDLGDADSKVSRDERQRLVELYDRGIRYSDHWLGSLIASLRERGQLERTLVVVTSDHGEEFWDHGGLEHGHSFYDELLRVPLLMRIPGEGRGKIVDQQVGLIDVLPTILDIVGVDPPADLQGRSLRPLFTGGELPERSYFAESNHETAGLAMRTERWKLIRSRRAPLKLFDLWNDPNEIHNVCEQQREVCQRLVAELQRWREDTLQKRKAMRLEDAPAAEPDADTLDRLRALGYLE